LGQEAEAAMPRLLVSEVVQRGVLVARVAMDQEAEAAMPK
jgi:hypothetical protein